MWTSQIAQIVPFCLMLVLKVTTAITVCPLDMSPGFYPQLMICAHQAGLHTAMSIFRSQLELLSKISTHIPNKCHHADVKLKFPHIQSDLYSGSWALSTPTYTPWWNSNSNLSQPQIANLSWAPECPKSSDPNLPQFQVPKSVATTTVCQLDMASRFFVYFTWRCDARARGAPPPLEVAAFSLVVILCYALALVFRLLSQKKEKNWICHQVMIHSWWSVHIRRAYVQSAVQIKYILSCYPK